MTTHRGILTVILTTIWSLNSTTYSPAAPPPGKGKNQVKLSVTLTPSSIKEGEHAAGTVSHDNSDLSSPVEVTLSSSDPGQATVPASVTIPAGSASVSFAAIGVEDSVADGDQSVTITAAAEGYQSGDANLTVTDPPVEYTIQEISVPGNGTVWINGITNSGFVYGWFTERVDGLTVYKSGYVYDQLGNALYDLNRDTGVLSIISAEFGFDGNASSVVGMNGHGHMVGYVEDGAGVRKGFVIDPTFEGQFDPDTSNWTVQALPDFASDATYGRRINEIGEVLGVYHRADGTSDAYLYNTWLGTPAIVLGKNLESVSVALNNLSQVAGVEVGGTAFLYDPLTSGSQEFTEVEYQNIEGLNDDGVFVGHAYTIETYAGGKKQRRGSAVGFRYDGFFEPLKPGLSEVKGINASGDVPMSGATILHTGFSPDFTEQTLTLTDLIADNDPLKSTFLDHSPEVFAITDRDGTVYSQVVVRLHDVPDGNGATRSNVAVILTPRVP